ncbi:MAG: 30S ribosome-binding factor RbfA [Thermodesulfobacteriota bacterium]
MEYKRKDRVGDLIRKEIATMLSFGEIKDSRIGLVTITVVHMSADLRNAKVYFSMIGSAKEREKSLKGLNSASGFIRRRLAKVLRIKRIPTVSFVFDDSIEYSSHIAGILKDVEIKDAE